MKSIGDRLPRGSRGVLMIASILGCYFLIRLSVSCSSEERSVLIHSFRCTEKDLMTQKIQVGRNRKWYRSLVFKLYHIVDLTCCLVAKLCPTHLLPRNSLGSSDHEISQARILEWVVIFFSKGSSQGLNHVSWVGRWILYDWATREASFNLKKF